MSKTCTTAAPATRAASILDVLILRAADEERCGWPSAVPDADGRPWIGAADVGWGASLPADPAAILLAANRWRRGEGPRPSRATTCAWGSALLLQLAGLAGPRADAGAAAAAATALDAIAPGFLNFWLAPIFELGLLDGGDAGGSDASGSDVGRGVAAGTMTAAADEAAATARIDALLAVVRVAAVGVCGGDVLRSMAAVGVVEDFGAVRHLQALARAAASTAELLSLSADVQRRRAALHRLIVRLDQTAPGDPRRRIGRPDRALPSAGANAPGADDGVDDYGPSQAATDSRAWRSAAPTAMPIGLARSSGVFDGGLDL